MDMGQGERGVKQEAQVSSLGVWVDAGSRQRIQKEEDDSVGLE